MKTDLFVIANVKQLRTGGSFRILLPFFQTSWGFSVLNSAIFNSFHSRVEFGTILGGLRNFGEGVFEPPKPPPPRYATEVYYPATFDSDVNPVNLTSRSVCSIIFSPSFLTGMHNMEGLYALYLDVMRHPTSTFMSPSQLVPAVTVLLCIPYRLG